MFTHVCGSDVVLSAVPTVGDPDMFVSCQFQPDAEDTSAGPVQPSHEHNNASSTMMFEDAIVLDLTDSDGTSHGFNSYPLHCREDVYYVGVYCYPSTTVPMCEYVITAAYVGSPVTVNNGVISTGTVYRNVINYYTFQVTGESMEITVTVTVEYGDADLYVTTDGTLASKDNYAYASIQDSYHDDRVVIPEGACIAGTNAQVSERRTRQHRCARSVGGNEEGLLLTPPPSPFVRPCVRTCALTPHISMANSAPSRSPSLGSRRPRITCS